MTTVLALHISLSCWRVRQSLNERGASLVEYSLLVALIAVVAIGAVAMFGGSVNGQFSEVASNVAD